ncbi:CTP pyrophosphohydrolase [Nocardia farcinica]|uniref:8-oxo-dGTP diphosphatase n=1 Tax=Nocardia farcinica TaxID=37329 RepID=A0A449H3U3_NOCFR|nr:CTP pyrophosphohydrolase [Nocardia farcinica]
MNLMSTRLEDLTARAECDGVQQLVVGAIVEHDSRILLLRPPGNDFMGGIWELPSGKVEPGEILDQVLAREVEEETGLRVPGVNRYIPCMRGEHPAGGTTRRVFGLIPPAGGTSRRRRQSRNPGLVPACAGSTALPPLLLPPHRAHPRVRGEHLLRLTTRSSGWGSSPRARGARGLLARRRAGRGLIPACAGSTEQVDRRSGASKGSSPRARGALTATRSPSQERGLIPACAGARL